MPYSTAVPAVRRVQPKTCAGMLLSTISRLECGVFGTAAAVGYELGADRHTAVVRYA
jgi:hypothetical protein